jgi:hypothetical protein
MPFCQARKRFHRILALIWLYFSQTAVKPSEQPRTKSCAVSGNSLPRKGCRVGLRILYNPDDRNKSLEYKEAQVAARGLQTKGINVSTGDPWHAWSRVLITMLSIGSQATPSGAARPGNARPPQR